MLKQLFNRSVFLAVIATLVLGASVALPQAAYAVGSPSKPDITGVGCTVTIVFQVPNEEVPAIAAAGIPYTVDIWDDGVKVKTATQMGAPGDILTFQFTFTVIGPAAPGLGIDVIEDGTSVFYIDDYTGIDVSCVPGAVGPGCGLTDGAYQVLLPEGAQLFWGADKSKPVSPVTSIPRGNVVTVIDNSTAGWYKILWACGTYYIEAKDAYGNPAKITKPFISPKSNQP
jgi:hypothetical protein